MVSFLTSRIPDLELDSRVTQRQSLREERRPYRRLLQLAKQIILLQFLILFYLIKKIQIRPGIRGIDP